MTDPFVNGDVERLALAADLCVGQRVPEPGFQDLTLTALARVVLDLRTRVTELEGKS